MGLNIFWKE